jgi:hypothetical protein
MEKWNEWDNLRQIQFREYRRGLRQLYSPLICLTRRLFAPPRRRKRTTPAIVKISSFFRIQPSCPANPSDAIGTMRAEVLARFNQETFSTLFSFRLRDERKPPWAGSPGSFVNWMKNLQKTGTKLTAEQAGAIVAEAKSLGVEVRLDPPHPGTNWDVPHLNILNIGSNGQVHLEVPPGCSHAGVPQGHP